MYIYQEYLQRLARCDALRGSSLLQRFLTNGHEIDGMFEPESVSREAERKVASLRNKLVIEKGQNLDVFLDSFIASAEPAVVKRKSASRPPSMHGCSRRRHNSADVLPPVQWSLVTTTLPTQRASSSWSTVEGTARLVLYTCRNLMKVSFFSSFIDFK